MKQLLVFMLCCLSIVMFAGSDAVIADVNGMAAGGIGLGSLLAVVLSWSRNKSILWAIIHFLFGWLYVIYFVFTR